MTFRQLSFPVLVRPSVAPFHHGVELFIGPGIEVYTLDLADVDAKGAVDAGTADADEDP